MMWDVFVDRVMVSKVTSTQDEIHLLIRIATLQFT